MYLAIRAPRVLRVAKHTLSTIIDMSMYSFIHKPRYLYSLQYSILELEHIKLKVEQGFLFFLKCIIFVLLILMAIPLFIHHSSKVVSIDCNAFGVGATRAMSSAKANAGTPTSLPSQPTCTPNPNLRSFFSRSLMYKLKSEGDRIQPCLTPLFTSNQGVQFPFTSTQHWYSSYKLCKVDKKGPLMPYRASLSHRHSRLTESNAFLKSTKQQKVSLPGSLRLRMILYNDRSETFL